MVSGGFDPVHVGHIRMIKEAAQWGNVIVVINSDDWLMRKKGYVFMPWKQRVEIMGNIKGVTLVTGVDDTDGTVCHAIGYHRPDSFANGGIVYFCNAASEKGIPLDEVAAAGTVGWTIGQDPKLKQMLEYMIKISEMGLGPEH